MGLPPAAAAAIAIAIAIAFMPAAGPLANRDENRRNSLQRRFLTKIEVP